MVDKHPRKADRGMEKAADEVLAGDVPPDAFTVLARAGETCAHSLKASAASLLTLRDAVRARGLDDAHGGLKAAYAMAEQLRSLADELEGTVSCLLLGDGEIEAPTNYWPLLEPPGGDRRKWPPPTPDFRIAVAGLYNILDEMAQDGCLEETGAFQVLEGRGAGLQMAVVVGRSALEMVAGLSQLASRIQGVSRDPTDAQ